MNKRLILYVVGFIVVATAVTAGMVALSQSGQPKTSDTSKNTMEGMSEAEHKAMNNDNGSDAQVSNSAEDLTSQTEVSIDIKDFAYSEASIKIKKGTKVTWTNQDVIEHNVMQDHSDGGTPHDAPAKGEVRPDVFAGQLLTKGQSYSFTFNDTGAYPYHCSPHPNMKGSVTVVE